MATHISTSSNDLNDEDRQSFEEGSSTGGSNDGYMTPDEYAVDEHDVSSEAVVQVCILVLRYWRESVPSCFRN